MTRIIEEIDNAVKKELRKILYLATVFILGFVTGISIAAYASGR